jgi:carbon-monoxide dehydrogenase small subunit
METKAFLEHNPNPTEDEIKEAISGHICRCTGYIKIIEAIILAAQKISNNKNSRK